MFGIGFTELLLISIIAILFLGPDKLPGALVDMAKFIKSIKKTISEAKNSLEEEVNIAELKEEALSYKKQLDDATNELKGFKNLSFDDLDNAISYEDKGTEKTLPVTTQVEAKNERVTFKKKTIETPTPTKGDV